MKSVSASCGNPQSRPFAVADVFFCVEPSRLRRTGRAQKKPPRFAEAFFNRGNRGD